MPSRTPMFDTMVDPALSNPLGVWQPLYHLILLSFFPVFLIGDAQCRHNTYVNQVFPDMRKRRPSSRQIGRYIRYKNSTISYQAELCRIVVVQQTNTLLSLRRASWWIVYALWLLLMCIILFTVRNLNNGNLCDKSVCVYLAVLAGVPCPLKITLQCAADKKFGNHCCDTLSLCIKMVMYYSIPSHLPCNFCFL